MKSFGPEYWKVQYAEPESIDGIGNAKDHSRYLSAFFNLEGVEVRSMVDLGFGPGVLFKEMLRTFRPRRALGIEPSEHVFKRFHAEGVKTRREDILSWCRRREATSYDLGLCTSVLQYLTTAELREALPVLSRRIRYLYLTVPTDLEYQRQKTEQHFADPHAYQRSRATYHRLLRPHFTFLSTRVLESRHFYDERSTLFNDLLFRF